MALRTFRGGLRTLGQTTFNQQTWGLTTGDIIIDQPVGAFIGRKQQLQLSQIYERNLIAIITTIVEVINGQQS